MLFRTRASEKFRVFMDGKRVPRGELTLTAFPWDGALCSLDDQVVRVLEIIYQEFSGEVDEIHLEQVRE